ncbi:hypothetical protein [Pedobacter sp. SL55]|uniref:hypothetical protein n=1 Tax=Pedobacter sp. SL55 TaxID=2995161 RepID=UPI002270F72A|nr:hypothetical protein [Pedobacter sp. SL55]WAC42055.1 hypothetical protein OVA16_06765 [Pedobacter sp. SL55]
MKKLLFYLATCIGFTLMIFGAYETYLELLKLAKYSKLKSMAAPVTTEYGSSIKVFENNIWKSFLLWAIISIIGWIIIFYSDKFFSRKRWINDEYAPMIIIILLAIPAYYFFSAFNN